MRHYYQDPIFRAGCFVFFNEMVSQVQQQEETQERLGKRKFIILTGPRDRRHGMPLKATWESHQGDRIQKTGGGREHLGHSLYWGFQGKGEAGHSEPPQIGQCESFQLV